MPLTLNEKMAFGTLPEPERIKTMLSYPSFRHISYRDNCLRFYERVSDSPSGCELMGGVEDTKENRKIIMELNKQVYAGGHMGNA
jgi:hypothetical protein